MCAFVRKSHFRHVFGTAAKKDHCYAEGVRISKNSVESPYCAVNPKFLAIIVASAGGGAFLVLKHDELGRLDPEHGRVGGHKQDVLDVAWNPFDDNMIASCSEDTTVKIWQIPDDGLGKTNLTEPLLTLEGVHQRKVHQILWHPTASNILLSASYDPVIAIWNLETGEAVVEIDCHPDLIYSVDWNTNGSLIATTCKDKKIRVIDVRKGTVVKEASGHEGAKPQRVAFCENLGYLFTCGFSKMSARQYAVWDTKKETLEQLTMEEIDQSNATLFIHYDPDTKMIYLAGKGDSIIRYYELVPESPHCHWLTNYSATTAQRGVCYMPKRGCNVNINEVAKCFKLIAKGASDYCEPISFTVPRKSELFQEDLFPDTKGDEPSLTADEWLEGKDADPKLISLRPVGPGAAKTAKKVKKGLGALGKKAPKKTAQAADEEDLEELVKKLKLQVDEQEKRIKALEEKTQNL
mmetsp:Transcript_64932/g.103327  ORF Transcript_64932/g.103327 Transcript_64932/m.103327 type:complete len:464 (-) Transcript_64932:703-2094(-)